MCCDKPRLLLALHFKVWLMCYATQAWAGLDGSSQEDYERGISHLEASELDEAIEAFNAAIEKSPNFFEAYEARAEAHDRRSVQLSDVGDRDIAVLRAMEDRFKAGEIQATDELAFGFASLARRAPMVIGIYLLSWILGGLFIRGRRPSAAVLLVFLFFGPIGLLLLLVMFPEEANRENAKDPENDHAIEARLRGERVAEPGLDADVTVVCRHCGRENSALTRICPRCENRLA